jgi:hypothetical protein
MTMRGARRALTLAAVAVSMHRDAAAQVARPLLRSADRLGTRPSPSNSLGSRADPGHALAAVSTKTRRSLSTSVSVVGGAVVGAWLGYFLSQVVRSDWEGMRASDQAGHRRTFAFSGAAVGALAGYLVRPRPQAPGVRERQPTYIYVPQSARQYITRDELRRAPVVNALEAIEALRPEWLGPAYGGTHARAEVGAESAPDTGIVVYVVHTRIGGPEALAEISIPEIEELRLYDAQEAERRWGTRNPRGAIEVVPASAAPR